METIHITMPDGAIREVPLGTTAAEIAQQISPRLAKEALVARISPSADAAARASAARRRMLRPKRSWTPRQRRRFSGRFARADRS